MNSMKLNLMSADEIEAYLCELWKRQLKLESLSLKEDFTKQDFMSLGGQSVDMFRMLAKLEDDFSLEIDFDEFFDSPNILALKNVLLTEKRKQLLQ